MATDTTHGRKPDVYKVAVEIDIDCEPLLDCCDLDYTRSETDDTQNVVEIELNTAEYKESIYDLALGSCNEQTIASYILNPELGEYTTSAVIETPQGDRIIFE